MSIVDFLLARLVEDENASEAHMREMLADYPPWGDLIIQDGRYYDTVGNDITNPVQEWVLNQPLARSALRWRREIEAKRRIVEAHQGLLTAQRQLDGDDLAETVARSGAVVSEGVIRLLAAVYENHPDFDPEWRIP